MSAPVVDVLRAVLTKIATPERWTKGAPARAANGGVVLAFDQDAICWCVEAAIGVVVGGDARLANRIRSRITLAATGRRYDSLQKWQDAPKRTHAEVVAAIEKAIAKEERHDRLFGGVAGLMGGVS